MMAFAALSSPRAATSTRPPATSASRPSTRSARSRSTAARPAPLHAGKAPDTALSRRQRLGLRRAAGRRRHLELSRSGSAWTTPTSRCASVSRARPRPARARTGAVGPVAERAAGRPRGAGLRDPAVDARRRAAALDLERPGLRGRHDPVLVLARRGLRPRVRRASGWSAATAWPRSAWRPWAARARSSASNEALLDSLPPATGPRSACCSARRPTTCSGPTSGRSMRPAEDLSGYCRALVRGQHPLRRRRGGAPRSARGAQGPVPAAGAGRATRA